MTPSLSPQYAHWAAGAAVLLALVCYALAWVGAAAVAFVLGLGFEAVAWAVVWHGRDDA